MMSDNDWAAITPALKQKLNPDHVKKPNGRFGPKGDYIEGWLAIQEANEIFGFGAWSYTITGLTKDACEKVTKPDGKEQWQAAYTCIVRVQVGDVIREDVGFGSGFAAQIGDAIEGATKEAVTDALKRALRTFGNRFGLALYDKDRANVGRDVPPEVLKEVDDAQTRPDLTAIWKAHPDLHGDEAFRKRVMDRAETLANQGEAA